MVWAASQREGSQAMKSTRDNPMCVRVLAMHEMGFNNDTIAAQLDIPKRRVSAYKGYGRNFHARKARQESDRQAKSHPSYSEGFFDAMNSNLMSEDCSPEYRAGWEAATRSIDSLRKAGFERDGDGFTLTMVLKK
jgi:hypothetical protein